MGEAYLLLTVMLIGAIGSALFWTQLGRWLIRRSLLWFLLVLILRPPGLLTVGAITVFVFRAPLWTAARWVWWRIQESRGLRLTFNNHGE